MDKTGFFKYAAIVSKLLITLLLGFMSITTHLLYVLCSWFVVVTFMMISFFVPNESIRDTRIHLIIDVVQMDDFVCAVVPALLLLFPLALLFALMSPLYVAKVYRRRVLKYLLVFHAMTFLMLLVFAGINPYGLVDFD